MGIDQSYTSTGYCVGNDIGSTGLADFGIISSDKKDDIVWRARCIADSLAAIAKQHTIQQVGLEGLAFGARGDATRKLAGLQFMIINSLQYDHQITCHIYAPGTIKKIATGKGNSPKTELLQKLPEEVRDRFLDSGVKKSTGLLDLSLIHI